MINTNNIQTESKYGIIVEYMDENSDAKELTNIFGGDYDQEYVAEQNCKTEEEKEALITIAKTDWVYGCVCCYPLSVVFRNSSNRGIIGYSLGYEDKSNEGIKVYEAINWSDSKNDDLIKANTMRAFLDFAKQKGFKKLNLTIKNKAEYLVIQDAEFIVQHKPFDLSLDNNFQKGIEIFVEL